MRIHIVTHACFESPASLVPWAQSRGHDVTYTHMYKGDTVPDAVDGFDALILMGGPQSTETTPSESPHFDAESEKNLIKKAMEAHQIVLGFCLGAQMIAATFGAVRTPSPHKEVGIYEVDLSEAGRNDPLFAGFPPSFMAAHWHDDMPGEVAGEQSGEGLLLDDRPVVLASSAACPRQIVRYAPLVYGFQCHLEFTQAAVEAMIQAHAADLVAAQNDHEPYVATHAILREHDYNAMNAMLFTFLDKLVEQYSSARASA